MAFGVKTNERPGTRCQVRYVRMSATKARVVLDNIRGRSVREAAEILAFTERAAAEVVAKALNSAVSNAITNDGLQPQELFVSACFADEGPTLKRWRPRARGRATRIRKRTCHITLIVSRFSDDRLEVLRAADAAKTARGGGRARTARDAAEARRRRVAGSRSDGDATADAVTDVQDDVSAASEVIDAEVVDEGTEVTDAEVVDEATEVTDAEVVDDVTDATDAPTAGPWDGSALPQEDGSGPEGYEIKGNEESKLYHEPGSRYYDQTKAEYYFATVDAAEAAGFSAPGSADAESSTEEDAE
jgi:large subunit ribosomal protein L22